MNFTSAQRFLAIYSGVLTTIFAATILGGLAKRTDTATFDEINVQRINIVEPDGTLRMALSDKSRFPGLIIKRKEYPYDRKTAGVLFFDDEGTENGGLSFGGRKDKNGHVQASGHLSFDQYDQDQVFSIDADEENGRRRSGLAIWDRGDYPILDAYEFSRHIQKLPPAQQQTEWSRFMALHPGDARRAYLGRTGDRSVGLRLMDESGHDRVSLRVNPDGSPVMQFLDATGKITAQFPAALTAH